MLDDEVNAALAKQKQQEQEASRRAQDAARTAKELEEQRQRAIAALGEEVANFLQENKVPKFAEYRGLGGKRGFFDDYPIERYKPTGRAYWGIAAHAPYRGGRCFVVNEEGFVDLEGHLRVVPPSGRRRGGSGVSGERWYGWPSGGVSPDYALLTNPGEHGHTRHLRLVTEFAPESYHGNVWLDDRGTRIGGFNGRGHSIGDLVYVIPPEWESASPSTAHVARQFFVSAFTRLLAGGPLAG